MPKFLLLTYFMLDCVLRYGQRCIFALLSPKFSHTVEGQLLNGVWSNTKMRYIYYLLEKYQKNTAKLIGGSILSRGSKLARLASQVWAPALS